MVICTYNRAELLAALLQTVCDQPSANCAYEVIIVDNNSSDTTPLVSQDFAARYPYVRYCLETKQGLSHARNCGWRAAKGEYVAYLDDDCQVPPDWLRTADEIIRTVAPLVFGGPYVATYNSRKPTWFKDEYGSYAPCPEATFINERPDLLHGGNLVIARKLLAQIGGFDVTLGMSGHQQAYGEETALLRHLRTALPATTFYYSPAFWVYHLVRPEKMTLRWQVQAQFSKGRSIARVYVNRQAQQRGRTVYLLRMAGLALLIGANLVRGIFWRNRAKLPHLYNFVYEVILPSITRLGQQYEYARQPTMQHAQRAPLTNAPLPSPPESATTLPLVSILVAAWNEEAYLVAFLESYRMITYPHKELILCAGGDDHTYQLAQGWQGCGVTLLLQQKGEGKYRALQRSLLHARGTIIFLTDADCVLHDDSFQRLIYPIATGSESVVTGTFKPLSQQQQLPFVTAQWLMQRAGQIRSATAITYSSFLVGANSALTRTLVESCWQTPLDNAIGEDYHLALEIQRRGIQIRQCLESQVQTRYPHTFHKYLMTKSRWHRSWLLHHYRQGDRRWVRNVLSAVRFQLLLALPLLPLLLGPVGVVIWLVLWAYPFTRYWLSRQLVVKAAKTPHAGRVQIQHLFLLMLADFCAWAVIPFQLMIPRWRRQW